MSQPADSSWWVSWAIGASTVGVALWHIGAKVFGFVTRTELAALIAAQDSKFLAAMEQSKSDQLRTSQERQQETLRLHRENREADAKTAEHISELQTGLARIEGKLSSLPILAHNKA